MAKKQKTGRINSTAAIHQIKVESQPNHYYTAQAEIIPYGVDNCYPSRVKRAIESSQTASGCVDVEHDFIFGNGVENGDFIVNRNGETFNQVLDKCIENYAELKGFGLHFNFNVFGQIVEMFFVDYEYVRKLRNLKQVEFGLFEDENTLVSAQENYIIDLYNCVDPLEGIKKDGVRDYKGQIHLFTSGNNIYPKSQLHASLPAAEFEYNSQIYSLANIKNGFSAHNIIFLDTISNDKAAKKEAEELTENLKSFHGAERAGSSIVVNTPMPISGQSTSKEGMVQPLTPTNVDSLYLNQNQQSERAICVQFKTPIALLGVNSPKESAFSQKSYNDAFNYKNGATESKRKDIERFFNDFLPNTIFGINEIEIQPLEMKSQSDEVDPNKEEKEVVEDEQ